MTVTSSTLGPIKLPFAVYKVGGCVRDALLGQPINDIDYVVVGATPEAMVAAGYRPVRADFPIFLHPDTQEEYALARTERKNGHGYNGFTVYAEPSVTLEEDLSRRDFTINAMAMDDNGTIIDPYNGQDDLQQGILRHVGPAFADDPLRVLRGARFAARYGFTIAPETRILMRHLVETGEMQTLTRERIYVEFTKGFACATPSKMLAVLNDVGALGHLFPEADQQQIKDPTWYKQLDRLTHIDASLGWSYLLYKLAPSQLREAGERWRCQKQDINIVSLVGQLDAKALNPEGISVEHMVNIWTNSDARRQWLRFEQALRVLAVQQQMPEESLEGVLLAWRGVDSVLRNVEEGAVLKNKLAGEDPRSCILRHRISALTDVMSKSPSPV